MGGYLRLRRRCGALGAGLLLLVCLGLGEDAARDPRADTIRFDAVLELNAPLLGTNTLLFARYWVGTDCYSIGVIWAEPSLTGLNFPTKPMTLSVHSDRRSLSIASERQPSLTTTFTKPVGQRGVFQHKFNSYPLADLRFGDSESLASRLYFRDLRDVVQDTNDRFSTVDIATSSGGSDARSIAKAVVRRDDSSIADLNLLDADNQVMKSIHYEYTTYNDKRLLRKETVLLPETFLTVGFLGQGATITINGQKRTFKELPTLHHEGGRDCTIDYSPFTMEDRSLAVPASVVVRKADDRTVVRMAHMFNFVHLKLTADEAEQAAQQFAHMDAEEQALQQLLERYWLKDSNGIAGEDAATLKRLRAHFEDVSPRGKIVGEQLKRLSLLVQLDWLQGDDAIQRHFREYLATLAANGLWETLVPAGCEMIDVTARWHRFTAADRMLEHWLDTVIAERDPASIRRYAESQGRRGRWWIAARLLEKSLQSQDWGSAKLAGQVLRSKTLQKLNDALQTPYSGKVEAAKAQVTWATSSCGAENVTKALHESLQQAGQTFSDLAEPSEEQKEFKSQLDAITKALPEPVRPRPGND